MTFIDFFSGIGGFRKGFELWYAVGLRIMEAQRKYEQAEMVP